MHPAAPISSWRTKDYRPAYRPPITRPARGWRSRNSLSSSRRNDVVGCCPGERRLQPVVTPEQLIADGEGGRAEDAARGCLLGLLLKPIFYGKRARFGESGVRVDAKRREDGAERLLVADIFLLGVVSQEHSAGEGGRPAIPLADQGEPGRLEPILREAHRRELERNPFAFADAREVAPHIAPLRLVDVEWRVGPPKFLEDRPEQEGPPAQLDPGLLRQRLDAHRCRIGIGAAELVPELECRHVRSAPARAIRRL